MKNAVSLTGQICISVDREHCIFHAIFCFFVLTVKKDKRYNKTLSGKSDESLRRKATGPVKWQPAASREESTALLAVLFVL